jgi:hypothetical protein
MMERLPMGDDGGFSPEEFRASEKKLAAKVEKYAKKESLATWSTPEDVYYEFPSSFPGGDDKARKREMEKLLGPNFEPTSPQGAIWRYLNDPNNRENGAFRYLVDWGIDPSRKGEGIRLSFQRPPSPADVKEIERIFKIFGWGGEEYEVRKEPTESEAA